MQVVTPHHRPVDGIAARRVILGVPVGVCSEWLVGIEDDMLSRS
jgi:hypothetical protein